MVSQPKTILCDVMSALSWRARNCRFEGWRLRQVRRCRSITDNEQSAKTIQAKLAGLTLLTGTEPFTQGPHRGSYSADNRVIGNVTRECLPNPLEGTLCIPFHEPTRSKPEKPRKFSTLIVGALPDRIWRLQTSSWFLIESPEFCESS
jgi:hypothetical protein